MALNEDCRCGHMQAAHEDGYGMCAICYVNGVENACESYAATRQGAGTVTGQTPLGASPTLRELGIAVHVGTLVPTGAAVRLDVDDTARWLEPHEAEVLANALIVAATDAVHQDRAGRRGGQQ